MPVKMPVTLGACADLLYTTREKRLAMEKLVDQMQAEETALKEHIIKTLPKSQAGGISGKVGRVEVVTKLVPRADDWLKFYAFVKKTGNFHLLQKRLSEAAIQEIWESKKTVPGVSPFQLVTLSIKKA